MSIPMGKFSDFEIAFSKKRLYMCVFEGGVKIREPGGTEFGRFSLVFKGIFEGGRFEKGVVPKRNKMCKKVIIASK